MIYSHLTCIDGINGNGVGVSKKPGKSAATAKGESRRKVMFNRHMLTIWRMGDSGEGQ